MTSVNITEVFRFCPRCGNSNPSPGVIPFHCKSCAYANYFGPVAAVGGLVINTNRQLLLVRRAKNPGKGKWGLPGGFIDSGETAEVAVAREIAEETSLKVTRTEYLFSAPNHYDYKQIIAPVIDLFFLCEVDSTANVELAADELEHFEWTQPDTKHLDNMAFDSNRKAILHWLDHAN